MMADDLFGLSTNEYFTNPLKTFSQTGRQRIRLGEEGLIIDGPDTINEKRETAPIVIQRISKSQHATEFPFHDYAVICAVDITSGRIFASKAIEQRYIKPQRDPNAPPPPQGLRVDGGAVDLFKVLQLPRSPATLSHLCISG